MRRIYYYCIFFLCFEGFLGIFLPPQIGEKRFPTFQLSSLKNQLPVGLQVENESPASAASKILDVFSTITGTDEHQKHVPTSENTKNMTSIETGDILVLVLNDSATHDFGWRVFLARKKSPKMPPGYRPEPGRGKQVGLFFCWVPMSANG